MKSDIEEFANPMPRHVAVIMDGNGRWATKRGLARKFGHRAGVKTLMKIAKHAFSVGIEYVTIYAFSTENKYRPKDEVDALVDLIRKNFATVFSELIENGVKLRVLGDRGYFPKDVVEILDSVESDSVGGKNGVLNVAPEAKSCARRACLQVAARISPRLIFKSICIQPINPIRM